MRLELREREREERERTNSSSESCKLERGVGIELPTAKDIKHEETRVRKVIRKRAERREKERRSRLTEVDESSKASTKALASSLNDRMTSVRP